MKKTNPEKCDADVYDKGIVVGVYAMTKDQAEQLSNDLRKATGLKFDWNFVGGRVVLRFLWPEAFDTKQFDKAYDLCDDIRKASQALQAIVDGMGDAIPDPEK